MQDTNVEKADTTLGLVVGFSLVLRKSQPSIYCRGINTHNTMKKLHEHNSADLSFKFGQEIISSEKKVSLRSSALPPTIKMCSIPKHLPFYSLKRYI